MARYYRRRTYTRVVRPKKKWCSNFKQTNIDVVNGTAQGGDNFNVVTLAENKSESTSPTPVIVKTGNYKLQGDFYVQLPPGSGTMDFTTTAQIYIIYLPESVSLPTVLSAKNLVRSHPEWILSWRYFDVQNQPLALSSVSNGGKISMTSRLKRNLNSGDKIIALLITDNLPGSTTFHFNGLCQFWTCAN